MTSTFMPAGYELLEEQDTTKGNYWKPSQFKIGETKIRNVLRPISGWVEWENKKPFRYKPENKPLKSKDPENPLKKFWTFYVWDYERADLFILEITQPGLIQKIINLGENEDWGDLRTFDMRIQKVLTEKEYKGKKVAAYDLIPVPHKPMAPEIVEMLAAKPVRLEALYEGGNPWIDLQKTEEVPDLDDLFPIDKPEGLTEKQHAILDSYISDDAKAIDLIKKRFNLLSVYDLKPEDFDPIIEWLKQRKGGANGKTRVA